MTLAKSQNLPVIQLGGAAFRGFSSENQFWFLEFETGLEPVVVNAHRVNIIAILLTINQ